jgi:hypothetical protein
MWAMWAMWVHVWCAEAALLWSGVQPDRPHSKRTSAGIITRTNANQDQQTQTRRGGTTQQTRTRAHLNTSSLQDVRAPHSVVLIGRAGAG